MARVTWTPNAVSDLHEVQDYIARDSPRAAVAEARRIRVAVRRLATFPESGRIVPELSDPRIREVIVRSYRVLYTYIAEDNRVRVLAVVHASRQLPPPTLEHLL